MHPITVRTMKFDFPSPEDFHPLCIAGSSGLSYPHLAMSLYVGILEPFFVKSMRLVLDRIIDDTLREDVDRFARQEAQHYTQHNEFNKVIFAQGYPGLEQLVEKLKQDFARFLDKASDRYRLGYIEGFESYTTQFALLAIGRGLYDHPRTLRQFGELFKWHMLEEIEHRNVAYDVYQHLYGNYPYRAAMCLISQNHMFRFISDCSNIMSSIDVIRHGEQCRITLKQKLMMKYIRLPMRVRTMLPGYTPHKYVLPPNVTELSAHYSGIAQGIR